MGRLYVNQTLEKQLRQYCELNEIEDINAFANRCLSQGFNIIKFGTSPKDNVERESKGIKDIKKNNKLTNKPKNGTEETDIKDLVGAQGVVAEAANTSESKEESKPREERKEGVTVRKIRIIKKN
jgi:hypothetical protein